MYIPCVPYTTVMNVALQKNKQEEAKKGSFKPKSEILSAIFLPRVLFLSVLDGKGSIYFMITFRYRLFFSVETSSIVIRYHQTMTPSFSACFKCYFVFSKLIHDGKFKFFTSNHGRCS